MSRIERPAIGTNRWVIAALLDDFLRAVVMERAQALQLTKPKRIDVTSVRNDMVRDAGCSDPAFARAHATERLDLQLIARPFAPTFSVQMSPSAHAQYLAHQLGREQEECADARCHTPSATLLERADGTLVAWYRCPYAPRTGGAYDSHHRTAGVAGCTRRRSGIMAA